VECTCDGNAKRAEGCCARRSMCEAEGDSRLAKASDGTGGSHIRGRRDLTGFPFARNYFSVAETMGGGRVSDLFNIRTDAITRKRLLMRRMRADGERATATNSRDAVIVSDCPSTSESKRPELWRESPIDRRQRRFPRCRPRHSQTMFPTLAMTPSPACWAASP
jgi:hypothetical protein